MLEESIGIRIMEVDHVSEILVLDAKEETV